MELKVILIFFVIELWGRREEYQGYIEASNILDENFYKEIKNELLESTYSNKADDKFEWVMRFIKTYKTLLSKKDADIYYNYCMAYIHFSMKEY